jgi:hypothetical protein
MDRISPIEPRPPWTPPIAPARPDGTSRERREERQTGDRKRAPRRERPPEERDPQAGEDEDGGAHIDVRA